MPNTLLTIDEITRECARVLHSNLTFLKGVNKDYDASFAQTGAKIGDTLRVRKPWKPAVTDGRVMTAQDYIENYVALPVTNQKHVGLSFTSAERTLKLDDYSERVITPAMATLASNVEAAMLLSVTKEVYSSVGTPGVTPAAYQVWGDAGQKLDEYLAPRDSNRMVCANPAAMNRTVDGLKGLFEDGNSLSDQYKNGVMKYAAGFKWAMDQNIINLTTGSRTGTILNNDASGTNNTQGNTTVSLDGLGGATQTVKKGEVFTIAGVYAVNQETKQSTGALQQFVVTADATGSGSAIAALSVSPAMYTTGGRQNIDAFPANDAAITFMGSASTPYPQNLAFHRDAFTFATADLEMPDSGKASRANYDGIAVRVWKQGDIVNDLHYCRVDVLFGYCTVYAELANRVWG